MKALIYTSPHAEAYLNDERATCRYNIPVLVVRMRRSGLPDEDLGPADVLPSGKRASDFVREYLADANPGSGRWWRTGQGRHGRKLAERFLKSAPPPPQRLEDLRVGDVISRSMLSDEANRALDGEEPKR